MKRAIGRIEDFPQGEVRIIDVGRHSIGIYHLDDGKLYALRNRCPHHGAPLCFGQIGGTMLPSDAGEYEFGMAGQVVRCPWHGWEFDIATGRTLFGIDKSRAVTYPVTVEDGVVSIEGKTF
jgi:nitrite reductase/ring-hydroxylating ferredoxin subunit